MLLKYSVKDSEENIHFMGSQMSPLAYYEISEKYNRPFLLINCGTRSLVTFVTYLMIYV